MYHIISCQKLEILLHTSHVRHVTWFFLPSFPRSLIPCELGPTGSGQCHPSASLLCIPPSERSDSPFRRFAHCGNNTLRVFGQISGNVEQYILHLGCVSVVERFAHKGVEATIPHVNARIVGVLTLHSFFLAHFYTTLQVSQNLTRLKGNGETSLRGGGK